MQFASPRLKVKRAEKHVSELELLLSEFSKRTPYQLVLVNYDDGVGIDLELVEPFPTESPLVIGDVVHNLRSALDILMCDVARHQSKRTDDINFPFAGSADLFEKHVAERAIRKLGQDVVGIVRKWAPYKGVGGNAELRGLHDLDITDKHILPILAFKVARIESLTVNVAGSRITMSDNRFWGGENVRLVRSIGYPVTIEKHGNVLADVIFGAGMPFEREAVVPRLKALVALTSDVIEDFERHCFGSSSSSEPATS